VQSPHKRDILNDTNITLHIPLDEEKEDETITVPEIEPIFAPGGPISRLLGERYRHRPGQVEMARLVRQAMIEGRPAIIEAGTGCGKSFAYLVPLIWSGARAIVSTANKTLQTQLWEKDIPALQRIAPRRFKAALLKGRSNYVCLAKLREARQQLALPGLQNDLDYLLERLDDTLSGDVEELRLFGPLREAVTTGPHDCLGRACPQWSDCYYEYARSQAEQADIVVVNHALLAFNVTHPILSPRPVLVVDEAHELERYVVNALRLTLEYTTIAGLINDPVVTRHVPDKLRQETVQLNHLLFEELAQRAPRFERRWAMTDSLETGQALADRVHRIARRLLKAYPPQPGEDEESEENRHHQLTLEWADELVLQLRALSSDPPADQVRYCEESSARGNGLERILLCQEPIQVADFIQEGIFAPIRRVICTGATLAVNSRFDYFRRLVGVPGDAIERVIDSPFDYPRQALLYTPYGLAPQYGEGEEEYVLALGREVWRLLQASRGRAFVLCTSARRMTQLYELISPHLEYPCYCQGTGFSRAELLERFQNDPDGAVLFATRSFWEGVDIPGEALSLVIIDKLPFAPHRDPVVQHRQQWIVEQGGNAFHDMTLPEAILTLKQGVGRLIRTETDRGVIALLDSRLNTKGYGRRVLSSLPPARRVHHIREVRAFFEQEKPEEEQSARNVTIQADG